MEGDEGCLGLDILLHYYRCFREKLVEHLLLSVLDENALGGTAHTATREVVNRSGCVERRGFDSGHRSSEGEALCRCLCCVEFEIGLARVVGELVARGIAALEEEAKLAGGGVEREHIEALARFGDGVVVVRAEEGVGGCCLRVFGRRCFHDAAEGFVGHEDDGCASVEHLTSV